MNGVPTAEQTSLMNTIFDVRAHELRHGISQL